MLFDPPYAIWSIWRDLSPIYKSFFLGLSTLLVYSLFLAAATLTRRSDLALTKKRAATLQQVVRTVFYLFGFLLFFELQFAYQTLGARTHSDETFQITAVFLVHFAFAANVFFVFLILHLIEWFVSHQVNLRTKNPEAAV
jgi:hypothetical protein